MRIAGFPIHPSRRLALIPALLCVVFAASCDSPCENATISEAVSPDGSLKAVVFERDCGATTGFSTQVSLLKASDSLPDSSGNLFDADDDHGKAASGPGGGPKVQLQWESNTRLRISFDPKARVFKQTTHLYSVDVIYSPLP